VEDAEEQLLAGAIGQSGVRARLATAVEEALFDAASIGAWDASFEDITQLAADIEGALATPGQYLDDVKHKAGRVRRAAQAIKASVTTRTEGRDAGSDPSGELFMRKMTEVEDLAAQAEAQAAAAERPIVIRTWKAARDIFDIAASLGQDPGDLMSINSDIDDLGAIPAGTPVRVFA